MIHDLNTYKSQSNLGDQLDAIMNSARELEESIKKEKEQQKTAENELIQLQRHYEKELHHEKTSALKSESEKKEIYEKFSRLESQVDELKKFSVKSYAIMKQNRENQITLKKALQEAQKEIQDKNKLLDYFGKKLKETHSDVNFIQTHIKKLYEELPSQGLTKEALMDDTYRKVLENISNVLDQRDLKLQSMVSQLIRNNFARLKDGLEKNLRGLSQKTVQIESNLIEDRADVFRIKQAINSIGQRLADFTKRPFFKVPDRKPPEFTK